MLSQAEHSVHEHAGRNVPFEAQLLATPGQVQATDMSTCLARTPTVAFELSDWRLGDGETRSRAPLKIMRRGVICD